MRALPLLLVTAAVAGCATSRSAAPQSTAAHAGLPFVEDNAAEALQSAKTRSLPLFVEAWAPW